VYSKTGLQRALLLTLALIPTVAATVTDGDWRQVTASTDVEVYTRKTAGSAFDEVRVRGSVCAPIDDLIEYISTVEHFTAWIPDTIAARLLADPSSSERLYYVRTDLPWPAKDRDMIYRLVVRPGATDRARTIDMVGVPDFLPPTPNVVRMATVAGHWQFVEAAGEGRTRVSLDMRVDPGGNVPPWLANRRIVSTPLGMLTNLAKHFDAGCQH
jgi:hypothetical protein